jgi:hypothetical protein
MKQTKTATIAFNKPKKKIHNKIYSFKDKDSVFVLNPKKYKKNVLDVPVWIRIVRVFKKRFRS